MASSSQAVPQDYHSVTPYLAVDDGARAIAFYKAAFGATEVMRMGPPGGQIGHAEIKIGDSFIMLADEFPDMKALSPTTIGGTAVLIMLYVNDVDDIFKRALAAGGKELHPLEDKFYGDRSGTLLDPFGHMWTISTHKEDVPPEEMQRREEAFRKKMQKTG